MLYNTIFSGGVDLTLADAIPQEVLQGKKFYSRGSEEVQTGEFVPPVPSTLRLAEGSVGVSGKNIAVTFAALDFIAEYAVVEGYFNFYDVYTSGYINTMGSSTNRCVYAGTYTVSSPSHYTTSTSNQNAGSVTISGNNISLNMSVPFNGNGTLRWKAFKR